MPSSHSSRDVVLERLAAEFVERHRQGKHPPLGFAGSAFAVSAFVCAMSRCSIFSGCKSHPASGSLRPVAIEATQGGNELVGAFETNVSHLAMQRTDRP